MSADNSNNTYTAPIDVASVPEEQSPAVSEDAFLRLQKQRPLAAGARREGERTRPSDITVTEPPYQFVDPQPPTELTSQSLRQAAMEPRRSSSPFASPSAAFRSASPRHLSPATSQIFERDVQESTLAPELSPAIPSHIQTEDHIPPVLEASSEVITNSRLNPDEVEIVTHTSHQPAAMNVAGGSLLGDSQSTAHISHSDLGFSPSQEAEDTGSNSYGAVDPTDPRRLSFISFADVVHAEHVETGREIPSQLVSPTSAPGSFTTGPASASPSRSPITDHIVAPLSPPMSASAFESSPSKGGPGSIASGHSASQHGDLTIETMAQTLEHAGSSDVVGIPGSPA